MNALTSFIPARGDLAATRGGARTPIVVGLINNMPDAALAATQRQFARLLVAGRGGDGPANEQDAGEVVLRCYSFPEIPRGAQVREAIDRTYAPLASLRTDPPDALIISGAAPIAAVLPAEPYWRTLTEVLDWAWSRQIPLVLSCLAAHAAVLHADGVRRHRLPRKCCGVFTHVPRSPHALLHDVPAPLRTPHSRWNDLSEHELATAGYQVLTASAEAGVDTFVHPARPATVYFNGHPEYDGDTLLREYRRDVACFLDGRQAAYPDLPRGYFDAPTELACLAFRQRAEAAPSPALLDAFPCPAAPPAPHWQPQAAALFRNWLDHACQRAS